MALRDTALISTAIASMAQIGVMITGSGMSPTSPWAADMIREWVDGMDGLQESLLASGHTVEVANTLAYGIGGIAPAIIGSVAVVGGVTLMKISAERLSRFWNFVGIGTQNQPKLASRIGDLFNNFVKRVCVAMEQLGKKIGFFSVDGNGRMKIVAEKDYVDAMARKTERGNMATADMGM